MTTVPKLLKSEEVIELLRVSKTTWKRWIRYNYCIKIYLFKLGNRWFITLEDLNKFIDEQKKKNCQECGIEQA
jgi:predicted site-specific integrase-resolvase